MVDNPDDRISPMCGLSHLQMDELIRVPNQSRIVGDPPPVTVIRNHVFSYFFWPLWQEYDEQKYQQPTKTTKNHS